MSVTTRYQKDGTDIGTYFCDLTNTQTVAGTKTFSTTPIVGTMATSDSSTSAASTAYVKNQAYATLASPTFTGTVLLPDPTANTKQAATTAFVKSAIDAIPTPDLSSYATKASPTFTGNVIIGTTTSTSGGNIHLTSYSTGITGCNIHFIDSANTVKSRIFTTTTGIYIDSDSFIFRNSAGTTTFFTANTTSTSFTGTVTATTPASTSNDTTVATTAFVTSKIPASSTVDLTPYMKLIDTVVTDHSTGNHPLKYKLQGHTENSLNLIDLTAGEAFMYFGYNNTGNFFGFCTANGATQLCSGSSGIACGGGKINNASTNGILRVYKIEVTGYNF